MYAQPNLTKERSKLVLNVFRALSYTSRSICDVLVGINFALYFNEYKAIGYYKLAFIVIGSQLISILCSDRFQVFLKSKQFISTEERFLLTYQQSTRGLLNFTLALQNFNNAISAIVVLNVFVNTMILEPVLNFYTA